MEQKWYFVNYAMIENAAQCVRLSQRHSARSPRRVPRREFRRELLTNPRAFINVIMFLKLQQIRKIRRGPWG